LLNVQIRLKIDTSAALLSESKVLVKPASTDSISTSASQEDHVSMGGYAARKSREVLENMAYILGIELMHCLQAVDLIEKTPSKKLFQIHQKVR
jgi:histidine ammonia-lyase